jgi:hypothetical protein
MHSRALWSAWATSEMLGRVQRYDDIGSFVGTVRRNEDKEVDVGVDEADDLDR